MQVFVLAALLLVASTLVNGQTRFSDTGLETDVPNETHYLIEDLSEDAAKIGLTEDRIRQRVELRLRQSGFKPTDRSKQKDDPLRPYLLVRVSVVARAFAVELHYKRPAAFKARDEGYITMVTSWNVGTVGVHANMSQKILDEGLSGLLDEFLNAYLRANPR
jgi:hypothetical protein